MDFDLRALKGKQQISDALNLSQRVGPMGPPPNTQQHIPGHPQITPQGVGVSGRMPLAGGQASGQAQLGPQGFQGAQMQYDRQLGPGALNLNLNLGPNGKPQGAQGNYSMPVGGGQFGVSADLDNAMRLQQLAAQYSSPGLQAGVGYNPQQKAVQGNVRVPFKSGGLAALHSKYLRNADAER